MKIIAKTQPSDIATVYIGETLESKPVEFVESTQPPLTLMDKWVLILSTLYGCPVGCRFCDAGTFYHGKVSYDDLLAQIDAMVLPRFPDRHVPVKKFKIQFARMGEPALNPDVLPLLETLPEIYDAPGLMPTLSTIAPKGADQFLNRVMDIKNRFYGPKFQLQFSIHTTDEEKRNWLMPVHKWSFQAIRDFGQDYFKPGNRKITLNFALAQGMPIDPDVLLHFFDPARFFIKITPVNPTGQADEHGMISHIRRETGESEIVGRLKAAGYETLVSIGHWEENEIGSNCGQHILNYMKSGRQLKNGYSYALDKVEANGVESLS